MFDFSKNIFEIPPEPKVIFVQDFLLSDLIGGAELSMDALHKSSPVSFEVIRSQQVTEFHIQKYQNHHWVFGNFTGLNPQILVHFVNNKFSYSVFEHDYKFCRYRSIEKHELNEGHPCNCNQTQWGQLIKHFYTNAKKVWWCSQDQLNRYLKYFPELSVANNEILSAIFDEDFFKLITPLIENLPNIEKKGWLTLESDSWIKGTEDAIIWLKENKKDYSFIKNMSHKEVLENLAQAEGFVCLPRGGDVSNRMVTEAKLLGCTVIHNNNVQHVTESWINHPDKGYTLNWLYGRRKVFWDETLKFI